ncbi:MAG: putative ribonuclease [Acidobacteriaceae bacterium]|nr:putative ribonuclease [Acidobacteriaceae bacterium]
MAVALRGALLLIALSVMIVSPQFGEWLAARVNLSKVFVLLWPYVHWSIAAVFTILAIEALYYLAPNVKQQFFATLPGAVLAVGCWIGLSFLLGIYSRDFANFNKTCGTLGAAIALMVWLYCLQSWWAQNLMPNSQRSAARVSCRKKREPSCGDPNQSQRVKCARPGLPLSAYLARRSAFEILHQRCPDQIPCRNGILAPQAAIPQEWCHR